MFITILDCNTDAVGLCVIMEGLKLCPKFTALNISSLISYQQVHLKYISGNRISKDEGTAIANGLINCRQLTNLDLSSNFLSKLVIVFHV